MIRPLAALALVLAAAPLGAQEERLSLTQVVDTAGLGASLRELPPPPAGSAPRSLYWMRYDSAGVLDSVQPISCDPRAGEHYASIASVLLAHARPAIQRKGPWNETLSVTAGSSPAVQVAGRLREDRPEVRDLKVVQDSLYAFTRRLSARIPALKGRQADVVLHLNLGVDGVPTEVSLQQVTGLAPLDDGVLAFGRTLRFRPGMIDRCPVPTHVEVPFVLAFLH